MEEHWDGAKFGYFKFWGIACYICLFCGVLGGGILFIFLNSFMSVGLCISGTHQLERFVVFAEKVNISFISLKLCRINSLQEIRIIRF